jgi:hypothetical protein
MRIRQFAMPLLAACAMLNIAPVAAFAAPAYPYCWTNSGVGRLCKFETYDQCLQYVAGASGWCDGPPVKPDPDGW